MTNEWVQQQIDSLLQEASKALAEADWDTVRRHATTILALEPENTNAKLLSDAAERATDKKDEALEAV